MGTARVDLHLHSRASTDTGNWFLRRAVLPESYTRPQDAYRAAKRRGMDFVTLSDHNTLDGALEIAHHPDAFVSVEVTTLFPEDETPLHVLVWDLTEAQWADIDRLRANVYELVDYLEAAGLTHALAHPLQRIGGDLGAGHIERCLLLFPIWEAINGARAKAGNDAAARIGASASREYLEKLADRHGLVPRGEGPPSLVAGSDDHGLLDVAATWTETPAARDPRAFLDHVAAGRTTPCGAHGTTTGLAHAMASLFLKGAAERGGGGIPPQLRGIVGDLVSHPMPEAPRAGGGPVDPMGAEVMRRLRSDRRLVRTYRRLGRAPDGAERSHARLRLVTGWAHTQLTDMALGPMGTIAGRSALGSLSDRLGWMLGAAAMVAPYLLAAGYHAREERFAAEMSEEFFGASLTDRGPVRVAMLTDTFDELNGVAGTLRRLAAHSARTDSGITVITCRERAGEGPGVAAVRPLAWMPVPAYADPSWRLGVPPLLDLLEVLQRRRVEVVHAATPGPMGLAGLLLARILGLPFVCSYHTELARYALTLTGDRVAAEIVRAGLGWFHGQAERVYAPSRATASGLVAEGVDPHKLVLFSRGVDTDLFRPERRTRSMRRRLGGPDATIVLSVGRISKEKGLLRLAEAMRRLSVTRPGLTLALVGDGPAREEVAAALAGVPHRFVGPLRGEELAAAYASADLFCLPSETETLGQVVLEAGASGLPVVVSDAGAACESVRDGSTGLVARAGDPDDLARRLAELVDDPLTRGAMGASARALMVSRPSWDRIFEGLAEGYQDLRGPRPAPPAASDAPFGAPAA